MFKVVIPYVLERRNRIWEEKRNGLWVLCIPKALELTVLSDGLRMEMRMEMHDDVRGYVASCWRRSSNNESNLRLDNVEKMVTDMYWVMVDKLLSNAILDHSFDDWSFTSIICNMAAFFEFERLLQTSFGLMSYGTSWRNSFVALYDMLHEINVEREHDKFNDKQKCFNAIINNQHLEMRDCVHEATRFPPRSPQSGFCVVTGVQTKFKCRGCRTPYVNEEVQERDWTNHKQHCEVSGLLQDLKCLASVGLLRLDNVEQELPATSAEFSQLLRRWSPSGGFQPLGLGEAIMVEGSYVGERLYGKGVCLIWGKRNRWGIFLNLEATMHFGLICLTNTKLPKAIRTLMRTAKYDTQRRIARWYDGR